MIVHKCPKIFCRFFYVSPQNLLAVAVATDITFKEAEQVGMVLYCTIIVFNDLQIVKFQKRACWLYKVVRPDKLETNI